MFHRTYFGSLLSDMSGVNPDNVVAVALKDTRASDGLLPPAKIARIYNPATDNLHEDQVFRATSAQQADVANDTLLFNGKTPDQYALKTDIPDPTGQTEPTAPITKSQIDALGVTAANLFDVRIETAPFLSAGQIARTWDGTTNIQDTVYNTTRLNGQPASFYTPPVVEHIKRWGRIRLFGTDPTRRQIIPQAGEEGGGFQLDPYLETTLGYHPRDLVFYWIAATTLTNLQAILADPYTHPDGSSANTPENVAFELVNAKPDVLEVLVYQGGSFVAKQKHNTGTTWTPNNRDYIRIPPGGWVTFKWFDRHDDTQWVVFGDLI